MQQDIFTPTRVTAQVGGKEDSQDGGRAGVSTKLPVSVTVA